MNLLPFISNELLDVWLCNNKPYTSSTEVRAEWKSALYYTPASLFLTFHNSFKIYFLYSIIT